MAIDTSWANVSLFARSASTLFRMSAATTLPRVGLSSRSTARRCLRRSARRSGAGNAMHFDGTNDYAAAPAHNEFIWFWRLRHWGVRYIAGTRLPTGRKKGSVHRSNYRNQSGGWAFGISRAAQPQGTGIYLSYWMVRHGDNSHLNVTTTVSRDMALHHGQTGWGRLHRFGSTSAIRRYARTPRYVAQPTDEPAASLHTQLPEVAERFTSATCAHYQRVSGAQ